MPLESFKHSYKNKTRESLPIAVYNSGEQQCEPGYSWGPGLRDHYLVHYVISGRGIYCADGITYPVQAGDTFLLYPSVVSSYTADEQEPWSYCWVGFNGAEAKLMMAQTPFSRTNPVFHAAQPAQIHQAITAIYQASGSTPASELRAIGRLYVFLALLVELADLPPVNSDLSLEYVEGAIRFIAHNYSRSIDIRDISASVGISRSHLYRMFMRHIGTPPNEYLTRYRISQACELLEHSNLPVSGVAASVGYEDQLYFSRVFKRVMGVPPTGYLKAQTLSSGV